MLRIHVVNEFIYSEGDESVTERFVCAFTDQALAIEATLLLKHGNRLVIQVYENREEGELYLKSALPEKLPKDIQEKLKHLQKTTEKVMEVAKETLAETEAEVMKEMGLNPPWIPIKGGPPVPEWCEDPITKEIVRDYADRVQKDFSTKVRTQRDVAGSPLPGDLFELYSNNEGYAEMYRVVSSVEGSIVFEVYGQGKILWDLKNWQKFICEADGFKLHKNGVK